MTMALICLQRHTVGPVPVSVPFEFCLSVSALAAALSCAEGTEGCVRETVTNSAVARHVLRGLCHAPCRCVAPSHHPTPIQRLSKLASFHYNSSWRPRFLVFPHRHHVVCCGLDWTQRRVYDARTILTGTWLPCTRYCLFFACLLDLVVCTLAPPPPAVLRLSRPAFLPASPLSARSGVAPIGALAAPFAACPLPRPFLPSTF